MEAVYQTMDSTNDELSELQNRGIMEGFAESLPSKLVVSNVGPCLILSPPLVTKGPSEKQKLDVLNKAPKYYNCKRDDLDTLKGMVWIRSRIFLGPQKQNTLNRVTQTLAMS